MAGNHEKQTERLPLGKGMLGPFYTFGQNKKFFSGAAGLHGTTHDYYRFAQMLLNKGELDGVHVVSRAAGRADDLQPDRRADQLAAHRQQVGIPSGSPGGRNAWPGSLHYLGGPGAYSWQGFFSTKFVNNPAKDTVILTMSTPGFDGTLPHNLRMVAAATAAVVD